MIDALPQADLVEDELITGGGVNFIDQPRHSKIGDEISRVQLYGIVKLWVFAMTAI